MGHSIQDIRPGYRRQVPQLHPPACWNCCHAEIVGQRWTCRMGRDPKPGLETAADGVCDLHPRVAVLGAG